MLGIILLPFMLLWFLLLNAIFLASSNACLMFCAICCHLHNLKYVKNTHGGVSLLVKLRPLVCSYTKSNACPWLFFTFLNLYKWYQIAQRTTYNYLHVIATFLASLSSCTKQNYSVTLKLSIASQYLSVGLILIGNFKVIRLLFLSSMTEIILYFYSRKLQMQMPLLEESWFIHSFKIMTICRVASCQDMLTDPLYLGH